MVFKRYNFQIVLRLVLLAANALLFSYLMLIEGYWATKVNTGLLLGFQLYLFYRFLTRWRRDLAAFAASVRQGDYSITYQLAQRHDPYFDLYDLLNRISHYVRTLKQDQAGYHLYMKDIVEHAAVGLIAYRESGQVLQVNKEALDLLRLRELKDINSLRRGKPEFLDHLASLAINRPGLFLDPQEKNIKLSVRKSRFVVQGDTIDLVSLVNIRPELEENELQSWQELISVLTHEIMNSVAPIHSMTGNLSKYLDRIEGNQEVVSKAKSGLDVVARRSLSLMDFVDRYRKISTVPLPVRQPVALKKLFESVQSLLADQLADITLTVTDTDAVIAMDYGQMEQVLINVIRNSALALEDIQEKRIDIVVKESETGITIVIHDNGRGIPAETLDKIFIPFFTTRIGGSGIGLTLSRQILHRHNGTIDISSAPGAGTTVILQLPR